MYKIRFTNTSIELEKNTLINLIILVWTWNDLKFFEWTRNIHTNQCQIPYKTLTRSFLIFWHIIRNCESYETVIYVHQACKGSNVSWCHTNQLIHTNIKLIEHPKELEYNLNWSSSYLYTSNIPVVLYLLIWINNW